MQTNGSYFPTYPSSSTKQNILSYNIMLKTGMIRQHAKGIYSWLPYGTLILRKLENLIRTTLNQYNMQECIIPCLQEAALWKKTNRYDAYGEETFRLRDRHDRELLLAPTAEDLITEICQADVKSYKQLPIKLYQIHWKFRDEIRPKNGAMRSREFVMKDGYSFDISEEKMLESYKNTCKAYYEIFNIKLGLNTILNKADNGAIGGDLSHEISIASDIGENLLEIDKKHIQKNKLSFDEWYNLYAKDIDKDTDENKINSEYTTINTTEIGHIFAFNQKYTKLLDFKVMNQDNQFIHPYMTSFGIGVSRLLQILVEKYYIKANEQLLLPDIVNPIKITIIDRNKDNINGNKLFKHIYNAKTHDLLFDNSHIKDIKNKILHHKSLGAKSIIIINNAGTHVDIINNKYQTHKKDILINEVIENIQD